MNLEWSRATATGFHGVSALAFVVLNARFDFIRHRLLHLVYEFNTVISQNYTKPFRSTESVLAQLREAISRHNRHADKDSEQGTPSAKSQMTPLAMGHYTKGSTIRIFKDWDAVYNISTVHVIAL